MCCRGLVRQPPGFPLAGNRAPAERRPLFPNRGRSSGSQRFPGKMCRARAPWQALPPFEEKPQPLGWSNSSALSIARRRSQTVYSYPIRSLPYLTFWRVAARYRSAQTPSLSPTSTNDHALPTQKKCNQYLFSSPNPCFLISSTTRNFRIEWVAGVRCVCYGFYAQKNNSLSLRGTSFFSSILFLRPTLWAFSRRPDWSPVSCLRSCSFFPSFRGR